MISFTHSRLHFETENIKASSYEEISSYKDNRIKVPSSVLLQLRNDMGFQQLRFYCHKKKVGTMFHIMTNVDPLGEAVVKYLTGDSEASARPQACGSYTVLPDDNSTLSEDCRKVGWNGTHVDGRWDDDSGLRSKTRIYQALRRNGEQSGDHSLFYTFPRKRNCDDQHDSDDSLSPGDFWAIFVR